MDSHRSECEAIVRRLWPYVDDRLPASDRERVTRHLEECTDCLSHFDFARAFLDAVHAARPPAREDAALRARVLAALSDHGLSI
jgi:anti-sigma factor (TIGR02949 family)